VELLRHRDGCRNAASNSQRAPQRAPHRSPRKSALPERWTTGRPPHHPTSCIRKATAARGAGSELGISVPSVACIGHTVKRECAGIHR